MSNKTAIVTGGSRGIGAAISKRLAADGFNVVVNYAGNAATADSLVDQIKMSGGNAVAVQADVTSKADVERLFSVAGTLFGGIDVLINNAGIMKLAPLAETDDEMFDSMVAINLKGTFNTLRQAAVRLRSGGRIINLSSSQVGLYHPTYAGYVATKAGVEAITHILVKELRGRSVTVNAVAPGPIATDLFLQGKTEEVIDRFVKLSPLERLGQPDDVANVISLLAGPDGSWINGQIIRVNGGVL
ncbi:MULTISPECIES: SDR family oxidoreductase [unclassified Sinorhizobium]|uniref:SDR family oxidoreductase n=1 Tax=unclassified Sinorhizobium TaxID=2613772 RepID=UPI003523FB12